MDHSGTETINHIPAGDARQRFALPGGDEEIEIDLLELAGVLLERVHVIIFCLLLGAVLLNAYAFFCISPTYQSTAKMYVVSASDDSVVDLSDLNLGSSLTSDYEELMLSYPVLDQVIEKLELDMTSDELKQMISIENPTDTRILAVTATTTDPGLSRKLADTMVAVSIDYLPKTMGTEEPNIAQDAKIAERKSAPSYSKYTLLGALLGAVCACGVIVLRHLMDDTVKTAEDLEHAFGLAPLTVVPDIDAAESRRGYGYGYGYGHYGPKKKNRKADGEKKGKGGKQS